MPIEHLGSIVSETEVTFRFPALGITPKMGTLHVKIIHEAYQFVQSINSDTIPMEYIQNITFPNRDGEEYEFKDVWSITLSREDERIKKKGRYLYRYFFKKSNGEEIDWIIDPFAQAFGTGKMSLFEIKDTYENTFPSSNTSWKTPIIHDLIIYELHVQEFAGNLQGVISMLPYLKDLGINCLQIMPISNIKEEVRWGYLPIGYFGVDERFGSAEDLRKLVEQAHSLKIAVILDVVYAHTDKKFAYYHLYHQLFGHEDTPITTGTNIYGAKVDYKKRFAQDFFFTLNIFLLDRFCIDGFRYDHVNGYYDGSMGKGYGNLVYCTYQYVKEKLERYPQFDNTTINIIQCAEYISEYSAKDILEKTYSNCCYQESTRWFSTLLSKEKSASTLQGLGLDGYGLFGFPSEINHNDDTLLKAPLQYIENHDHKRFLCNWGNKYLYNGLYGEGDREKHGYKVQPFLIGILTSKGVPLIWQGQEIGESYYVPENQLHIGRVVVPRHIRWDFFYDKVGRTILKLVRRLIFIRSHNEEFTKGEYYFHNKESLLKQNILLFTRSFKDTISIVILNFNHFTIPALEIEIPLSGHCINLLDGMNYGNLVKGNTTLINIEGDNGVVLQIKPHK